MLFDDFVWLMEGTWEKNEETEKTELTTMQKLKEEQVRRKNEKVKAVEDEERERNEILKTGFIELEKFMKVFDFAVKEILYVLRNGSPMEIRNVKQQQRQILKELADNIKTIDRIEGMIDKHQEYMIYDDRLQKIRKSYAIAQERLAYDVSEEARKFNPNVL